MLSFTSHSLGFGGLCVSVWYSQSSFTLMVHVIYSKSSMTRPECHWAKIVPSRSHASGVNVPLDFPPGFLSCCSVSVPFLFCSYMIFPWSQVLRGICLVNATLIIYSSLAGMPQSSVIRSILFTASSYCYILIFFFFY